MRRVRIFALLVTLVFVVLAAAIVWPKPPIQLSVFAPAETFPSTSVPVSVTAKHADTILIYLNGETVGSGEDSWNGTLTLPEGVSQLNVVARQQQFWGSDVEATANRTITVDATPPSLRLVSVDPLPSGMRITAVAEDASGIASVNSMGYAAHQTDDYFVVELPWYAISTLSHVPLNAIDAGGGLMNSQFVGVVQPPDRAERWGMFGTMLVDVRYDPGFIPSWWHTQVLGQTWHLYRNSSQVAVEKPFLGIPGWVVLLIVISILVIKRFRSRQQPIPVVTDVSDNTMQHTTQVLLPRQSQAQPIPGNELEVIDAFFIGLIAAAGENSTAIAAIRALDRQGPFLTQAYLLRVLRSRLDEQTRSQLNTLIAIGQNDRGGQQ